jgi:hypothetical protein
MSLNIYGCALIFFGIATAPKAFGQTSGCMDHLASNYNATATINDGSCTYSEASVTPTDPSLLPTLLEETSGLIFLDNRIWSHSDDTDATLYSFDPENVEDIETYPLTGTVNKDWEEVSQDANYIYVGDFGNNANGNRTNLKILRVEKNSVVNTPIIDEIKFSYALQTDFAATGSNNTDFDCEAFIVSADSIFLFTKEWVSKKTSIYSLPKIPGSYIAKYRGNYNVNGLITGATYLEAERLIVLTGYSTALQPFLMLLYDFTHSPLDGNKRKITVNSPFHQVEGIATGDGKLYYISNEKFSNSFITTEAKLQKVDLSVFLNNYLNPVTSLEETKGYQLTVYPNPSTNIVTIESQEKIKERTYTVTDALGRVMLQGTVMQRTEISVEGLKPGIYFYSVGNTVISRIVKK